MLGVMAAEFVDYPSALRPKGYCCHLCLSAHLSVHLYNLVVCAITPEIFFEIFLKLSWNILWVNISDKFDGVCRSSWNMCIIDQRVVHIKLEPWNLIQSDLLLGYKWQVLRNSNICILDEWQVEGQLDRWWGALTSNDGGVVGGTLPNYFRCHLSCSLKLLLHITILRDGHINLHLFGGWGH